MYVFYPKFRRNVCMEEKMFDREREIIENNIQLVREAYDAG